MTPREKALELIKKYESKVAGQAAIKQCALIAVDEIISFMPKLDINDNYWQSQILMNIHFLIEVKKEIKEL